MHYVEGAALLAVVMAAGLGVPAAATPAADAAPSLRDVLDRVGQYVVRYGESLATVVADEDYTQRLVPPAGDVGRERVLHSEIAFVKLADSREWQGFRDVRPDYRVSGASHGGRPGGAGQWREARAGASRRAERRALSGAPACG